MASAISCSRKSSKSWRSSSPSSVCCISTRWPRISSSSTGLLRGSLRIGGEEIGKAHLFLCMLLLGLAQVCLSFCEVGFGILVTLVGTRILLLDLIEFGKERLIAFAQGAQPFAEIFDVRDGRYVLDLVQLCLCLYRLIVCALVQASHGGLVGLGSFQSFTSLLELFPGAGDRGEL